jgi:Ankyrin repeats (3 copies)
VIYLFLLNTEIS